MRNEPENEGFLKGIAASISGLFVKKKPYIREPQGLLQPIVVAMYINTAEGRFDFDGYQPENLLSFSVTLEVFMGIDSEKENGKGSARFDINLCTPDFMLKQLKEHDCLIGHGFLIVPEYSSIKIKSCIDSYVKMCVGSNVEDVIRRVSLLGEWEDEWEVKGRRMMV
jgi:Immunity protein 8